MLALGKVFGLGGIGSLGAGMFSKPLLASDALTPPTYAWNFTGMFDSFDAASLRRGFEVYRNVCATCHSLRYIHYRELVGVSHTQEQAKALAQSVMVKDGPNDQGEMFERKGRLADALPAPYPNEEAARYSNGGAYPPDLSLITKARPHFENYLFSLLTGYRDAPHGVNLRSGLYFNPYMPGGNIAMPPPLSDELVDYEDGTPATVSQMAKDVTQFLSWAAEPESDIRKKRGIWELALFGTLGCLAVYGKRFKWNIYKTQKISYTNRTDFPKSPPSSH